MVLKSFIKGYHWLENNIFINQPLTCWFKQSSQSMGLFCIRRKDHIFGPVWKRMRKDSFSAIKFNSKQDPCLLGPCSPNDAISSPTVKEFLGQSMGLFSIRIKEIKSLGWYGTG
jgi:hypothetical protein